MLTELAVSEWLLPVTRFGRTGHVHSVFDRSFNIQIKQQLIHLSSYPKYLSSFGIHLADSWQLQQLLQAIEPGDFVKLTTAEIVIYSRSGLHKISLEPAQKRSLALPQVTLTTESLQRLTAALAEKSVLPQLGLPAEPQRQAIFALLEQGVANHYQAELVAAYLIGRGAGLTPSGDDLLVAYLATLKVLQAASGDVTDVLQQQPLNTTDVSRAYLKGMLANQVSLPLWEFFNSLKEPLALPKTLALFEQVLAIGHTSGKDMGYGIELALKYELGKREKNGKA